MAKVEQNVKTTGEVHTEGLSIVTQRPSDVAMNNPTHEKKLNTMIAKITEQVGEMM